MMVRLVRLRSEERGIVLILVMAVLLVLGIITASVLGSSIVGSRTTSKDRSSRGALGAALTGLDAAIYRLDVTVPADDSCPSLPDGTAATVSNGVCGPYNSDTGSSTSSQPLYRQSYQYWITPVMTTSRNPGGSTTDICTGTPPGGGGRPNLVIQDRCVTAVGNLLSSNGAVISTRRVQARVSASLPFFPIAGVFGTNCLTLNPQNNNIVGDTSSNTPPNGCELTTGGASSSSYVGSIGSNGVVRASIGTWNQEPDGSNPSPARLYLGNTSPTSNQRQTNYSFKFSGGQAGIAWTNGTGQMTFDDGTGSGATATFTCPSGGPGPWTYPCLPWGPFNNVADSNAPLFFDAYFPLPKMNVLFTKPPKILFPATTPDTVPSCPSSTSCDVAIYNNNSYLNTPLSGPPSGVAAYTQTGSAAACPAGASPYSDSASARRVLNIAANCTLKIPDGTYDFCSITINSGSKILPADGTATGEVRIFLDGSTRTPAAGGAPCVSSQSNVGKFIVNGTGSSVGAWMTNGSCPSATDPWTALAGQLYVWGAGDTGDDTQVTAPSTNHAIDITPGSQAMAFHGLLEAPNSTVNITHSNTCINGGLAAGALNISQNLTMTWDSAADLVTGRSTRTYYQTAYSTCATAIPTVASVQRPMDGC